jgi:nitronate monooxygenase
MGIRTPFGEQFGLTYPIVLAPMAAVSGGRLAAAVSNAGGLGLVGGGYGDPDWLEAQLPVVRDGTSHSWGIGLITWIANRHIVELALRFQPHVFFLSFGDPRPFAPMIKDAGCVLICQVQDVDAAIQAKAAGADVIVAQGTEAGGHGALRATLPLVPAVADAVAPTPVLAAGGIADGRSLAAALLLGAQGAVIGTRFFACEESLGLPAAKQRICAAKGGDTVRTRIFDVVRGYAWPAAFTGRALRNRFTAQWAGREEALAQVAERERPGYQAAAAAGDFDTAVVFAGEAVDLIHDVPSAAELVRRIGVGAEARLKAGPSLIV